MVRREVTWPVSSQYLRGDCSTQPCQNSEPSREATYPQHNPPCSPNVTALTDDSFHLYPDWWTKTVEWSNQYIIDHAISQRNANKPVIFEEYGWLTPEAREANNIPFKNETRLEVLGKWQEITRKEKLAGDNYWQFGYSEFSRGRNHDDGFTIYLDDEEAKELVYGHAKKVNEASKKRGGK